MADKNKVNTDTIYQEMYQEMRRYRDYELTSSTWYTAFLIAILGFLVTVVYGNNNFPQLRCLLTSNLYFQLFISGAITLLGCASVYSVRYVNLRYKEIKDYVFNEPATKQFFRPDWHTFSPKGRRIKPVCLIYIDHFLILAISNAIIFSSRGYCAVVSSVVILLALFLIVIYALPQYIKNTSDHKHAIKQKKK